MVNVFIVFLVKSYIYGLRLYEFREIYRKLNQNFNTLNWIVVGYEKIFFSNRRNNVRLSHSNLPSSYQPNNANDQINTIKVVIYCLMNRQNLVLEINESLSNR